MLRRRSSKSPIDLFRRSGAGDGAVQGQGDRIALDAGRSGCGWAVERQGTGLDQQRAVPLVRLGGRIPERQSFRSRQVIVATVE